MFENSPLMVTLMIMIVLHRFNGKEFVVNSELIQYVEATPDTILTLTNGQKIMIQESVDQVIEAVKKFKREILSFTLK